MNTLGNEIIAFGDKECFSIEIKPYKIPKKFYLRLWFKGIPIGDFKRGGSLDYIINSYFKLCVNLNFLYEKKFDTMTDRQIFDNIFYDMTVDRSPEVESKLFERQQMFSFEFGENQLNNFTFIVLHSEQNKIVKFLIYEMDGKANPKLHSFIIQSHYFFSIFKKFVHYCFVNGLKRNEPFFPKGLSFDNF